MESKKANELVGHAMHAMQPCTTCTTSRAATATAITDCYDVMTITLSLFSQFLSAQFPFIGDRLLWITNHDADISSRAPLVISEFIHKSPKWTSLVSGESLVVNSASRYQHIAINVVRLKCNKLQLLYCSILNQ